MAEINCYNEPFEGIKVDCGTRWVPVTDEMRRQMSSCVVSMVDITPKLASRLYKGEPDHPVEMPVHVKNIEVGEALGHSMQEENSGGNVNYYCVPIDKPKRPERAPYIFEVEDLIEALNMTFHEGTVLKSLVRSCVERELGMRKVGADYIRDAEKMEHSSKETLRIRRIRAEKGIK